MTTLAGALQLIAKKEVSPLELTRTILEKIEAVNDRMRCFITVAAEEVINGNGLLNGLPVSVKDLYDTKGIRTTAGSKIFENRVPNEDAVAVRKLKEAGAVIVGKTNLHEFAYGVTNINPHYGTARNPHDPGRVAGGSSGGSAVAVAAEMCDWAIGSDTGGSIRIPASLCGVAGFKPAFGSIDIRGVVPLSWSLDTLGPIAPDVTRAARAFSVMSGEPIDLSGLERPRLAIPRDWVIDLDEATQRAWAH